MFVYLTNTDKPFDIAQGRKQTTGAFASDTTEAESGSKVTTTRQAESPISGDFKNTKAPYA